MLDKDRSNRHKRNQTVEKTLEDLEFLLKKKNKDAIIGLKSDLPNIYIVGCARSGTTLLFQLLCKHLDVCYPSNLLSRFSYAPYIGSMIQFLMDDLDDKGELLGGSLDISLNSNLGKTKGALSPHEFWYYWRSIFDVDSLGYIKNINESTIENFHLGLDSIKSVFKKPMVLKGMIANNTISRIIRPNDIVIYIKRDTNFNAQSLYQSRINFFGDASKWYSFGIPNSRKYKSNFDEVVSQVIQTNKLIEDELKNVPFEKIIELRYENIESDINDVIERISNEIGVGYTIPNNTSIINANTISLQSEEWNQLNFSLKGINEK